MNVGQGRRHVLDFENRPHHTRRYHLRQWDGARRVPYGHAIDESVPCGGLIGPGWQEILPYRLEEEDVDDLDVDVDFGFYNIHAIWYAFRSMMVSMPHWETYLVALSLYWDHVSVVVTLVGQSSWKVDDPDLVPSQHWSRIHDCA